MVAALAGCQGEARGSKAIAVMTSLPILWAEEPDIGSMLNNSDSPPHWARAALEAKGKLFPLDRVANETMRGVDLAVLAQPRALSPEEMVALDRWVRGGGRLLLFADPMLTEASIFALGDKRRPQAIAMVDPLLAHWGLELHFDDAALAGERVVESEGFAILVNLPGELKATGGKCRVGVQGLVAQCRVSQGRVVIVADAALLEQGGEATPQSRISAINGLMTLVENMP